MLLIVSYKHPRKRKLRYLTFQSQIEADKAPKEIRGGYLLYAQHGWLELSSLKGIQ